MSTDVTNADEYKAYCDSVDTFLADMEGEPSAGYWECPCGEAECECEQEAHFSWLPCECCGGHLGGNRMDVIGWLKGARKGGFTDEYKWSGTICTDCEYFLAYGRLDDMTMQRVEVHA